MCAMARWEHCVVHVIEYRRGDGSPPQELLEITMPGARVEGTSHPFGLVGLLNQLGEQGWELVDVEGRTHFLKRVRPYRTQSEVDG
jgi:hypothetical protein